MGVGGIEHFLSEPIRSAHPTQGSLGVGREQALAGRPTAALKGGPDACDGLQVHAAVRLALDQGLELLPQPPLRLGAPRAVVVEAGCGETSYECTRPLDGHITYRSILRRSISFFSLRRVTSSSWCAPRALIKARPDTATAPTARAHPTSRDACDEDEDDDDILSCDCMCRSKGSSENDERG